MRRIKFENWPHWFRSLWPDEQRRWAIINGYSAFAKNHPAVLADIALRNNVFAPIREPDAHQAAIAEGRRQCALEIFKLANMNPNELFEMTKVNRNTGEKK